MSSHPVTYLRSRLAEVLAAAKNSGKPVVITQHGEEAVLQDVASSTALKRTLSMLKLERASRSSRSSMAADSSPTCALSA